MKLIHLIFIFALACTPASAQTLPPGQPLPDSSPFGAAIVHKNIPYVAKGTARQNFDLVLPAQHDAKPLPLIFWIHGGGWREGSKDWLEAPYLVRSGYAFASIGYRFSQEAIFPAQIQDCNSALNFIVAHASEYGIDPQRIIVAGGSAGGHLALLVGYARNEKAFNADNSIQPRAILDYYGVPDFTRIMDDVTSAHLKTGMAHFPVVGKQLLGVPMDAPSPQAKAASPVYYITASAPPTLILHGKNDDIVAPAQAIRLKAALDQVNVPNQLILLDGVGHAGPGFGTPAVRA